MREELKPQKLSFVVIARMVGERWQVLSAEEKEPYETEAAVSKEVYNAEMAKYKRTSSYKEYAEYLAEFKAKTSVANANVPAPWLTSEGRSWLSFRCPCSDVSPICSRGFRLGREKTKAGVEPSHGKRRKCFHSNGWPKTSRKGPR